MAHFFKLDKSMFGVDPWLTTEGLRDEEEPHETSWFFCVDRIFYELKKRRKSKRLC